MTHWESPMSAFNGCAVFSITQIALGCPLQFEPPMGSVELDILINAFIPGPDSLSQKKAQVTIDFLNTANASTLPGPVSRLYHVPQLAGWGIASHSPTSILPSPYGGPSTPVGTYHTTPTPCLKRARIESPKSSASFERQPGFSILTKDGIDITEYASRGPKTKKQRDDAAFMRKLGSCPACKKKKIKCDPSHQRPTGSVGSAASTPMSATPSGTSTVPSYSASSSGAGTSISPQSSLYYSSNSSPVAPETLGGSAAYASRHVADVDTSSSALSPWGFVPDISMATSSENSIPNMNDEFLEGPSWDASFSELYPSLLDLESEYPMFPDLGVWDTSLYGHAFFTSPDNPLSASDSLGHSSTGQRATVASSTLSGGEQITESCQPGMQPKAKLSADSSVSITEFNIDDWVEASETRDSAAMRSEPIQASDNSTRAEVDQLVLEQVLELVLKTNSNDLSYRAPRTQRLQLLSSYPNGTLAPPGQVKVETDSPAGQLTIEGSQPLESCSPISGKSRPQSYPLRCLSSALSESTLSGVRTGQTSTPPSRFSGFLSAMKNMLVWNGSSLLLSGMARLSIS